MNTTDAAGREHPDPRSVRGDHRRRHRRRRPASVGECRRQARPRCLTDGTRWGRGEREQGDLVEADEQTAAMDRHGRGHGARVADGGLGRLRDLDVLGIREAVTDERRFEGDDGAPHRESTGDLGADDQSIRDHRSPPRERHGASRTNSASALSQGAAQAGKQPAAVRQRDGLPVQRGEGRRPSVFRSRARRSRRQGTRRRTRRRRPSYQTRRLPPSRPRTGDPSRPSESTPWRPSRPASRRRYAAYSRSRSFGWLPSNASASAAVAKMMSGVSPRIERAGGTPAVREQRPDRSQVDADGGTGGPAEFDRLAARLAQRAHREASRPAGARHRHRRTIPLAGRRDPGGLPRLDPRRTNVVRSGRRRRRSDRFASRRRGRHAPSRRRTAPPRSGTGPRHRGRPLRSGSTALRAGRASGPCSPPIPPGRARPCPARRSRSPSPWRAPGRRRASDRQGRRRSGDPGRLAVDRRIARGRRRAGAGSVGMCSRWSRPATRSASRCSIDRDVSGLQHRPAYNGWTIRRSPARRTESDHDPHDHRHRPAVDRHDPNPIHRRGPEGELRTPGRPHGRGADGLRPVDAVPAPRPDPPGLARPRPLRAQRRAREHAALLAPAPDRLRASRSRTWSRSASGAASRPAIRNTA